MILVYDITNKETLAYLESITEETLKYTGENCSFLLIGCKKDLEEGKVGN